MSVVIMVLAAMADKIKQTIIRQLIKVLKVFLRILLIQNLHYKQLRAVRSYYIKFNRAQKGIFPSTGEKISFIYYHWNHLTIFS